MANENMELSTVVLDATYSEVGRQQEVEDFDEKKWNELLNKVIDLPKEMVDHIYFDLDNLDRWLKYYYDQLFDFPGGIDTLQKVGIILPKIWQLYGVVHCIALYLLGLQKLLSENEVDRNVAKDTYDFCIREYLGDEAQQSFIKLSSFAEAVKTLFERILSIRFQTDSDKEKKLKGIRSDKSFVPEKLKLLLDLFFQKRDNANIFDENEIAVALNFYLAQANVEVVSDKIIFDDNMGERNKNLAKLEVSNRLTNIQNLFCGIFPETIFKFLYPKIKSPTSQIGSANSLIAGNDDIRRVRHMVDEMIGKKIIRSAVVVQSINYDESNLLSCNKFCRFAKRNKLYTTHATLALFSLAAYVATTIIGVTLIAVPIVVPAVVGSIVLSWLIWTLWKAINGTLSASCREEERAVEIEHESIDPIPSFDPKLHEGLPEKLLGRHFVVTGSEERRGRRSTTTVYAAVPKPELKPQEARFGSDSCCDTTLGEYSSDEDAELDDEHTTTGLGRGYCSTQTGGQMHLAPPPTPGFCGRRLKATSDQLLGWEKERSKMDAQRKLTDKISGLKAQMKKLEAQQKLEAQEESGAQILKLQGQISKLENQQDGNIEAFEFNNANCSLFDAALNKFQIHKDRCNVIIKNNININSFNFEDEKNWGNENNKIMLLKLDNKKFVIADKRNGVIKKYTIGDVGLKDVIKITRSRETLIINEEEELERFPEIRKCGDNSIKRAFALFLHKTDPNQDLKQEEHDSDNHLSRGLLNRQRRRASSMFFRGDDRGGLGCARSLLPFPLPGVDEIPSSPPPACRQRTGSE